MKVVLVVLGFLVSIAGTYKVTEALTQEIVGALWVNGVVIDHGVHAEIVQALDKGNVELAREKAMGMENYTKGLLETLVSSLEGGSFYWVTNKEVSKGREYLNEISQQNITSSGTPTR